MPLIVYGIFGFVVIVVCIIAILPTMSERNCRYRIICRNGYYYPQRKVGEYDKKFEWQYFHKNTNFSLGEVSIEYVRFDFIEDAETFIKNEKGIQSKPVERVIGYY